MLNLEATAKVYLFTQAVDMRCGFDRLAALAGSMVEKTPLSGGVFAFFSRGRDRVKLLYWDGDGYCLWYKRLEQGTFRVRKSEGCEEITGVDLQLLLSGMDLSRVLFRKRVNKGVYTTAAA